jgi:signal transduction histidine kinase
MLDSLRARIPRLRRQDLADLALALLIAALSMAETMTGTYSDDRTGPVLLVDLALTLPLALRRRHPLLTFTSILLVVNLQALLLGDLEGAGLFLGLVVGSYSLGAHAPLRPAVAGIVAFVPAIMCASWQDTGDPFDDLAFIVTLVGGFWVAGRVVWSRDRLVQQLAVQSEELRENRDAEARALAAEQRARIGRDVHDVVAHSVSLMVVQAEAGEAQLPADHPSAESLRAIQRVGRSTLTELRGVLGALADDRVPDPAGGGGRAPHPGLRDAHRLAADLAEAGLELDLRVEGDLSDLPEGVDLAAYRILQEALTNALRHSPGTRVEGRVQVSPADVVLDVVDAGGPPVSGGGSRSRANGAGRGLVGMRERARVYGGQVEAGPSGDGFRVHAWIPRSRGLEHAQ